MDRRAQLESDNAALREKVSLLEKLNTKLEWKTSQKHFTIRCTKIQNSHCLLVGETPPYTTGLFLSEVDAQRCIRGKSGTHIDEYGAKWHLSVEEVPFLAWKSASKPDLPVIFH